MLADLRYKVGNYLNGLFRLRDELDIERFKLLPDEPIRWHNVADISAVVVVIGLSELLQGPHCPGGVSQNSNPTKLNHPA
jgi:hypothetical protein